MPRDTLSARLERERQNHEREIETLQKTLDDTEDLLTGARLENARLTAIMAVLKAALDQAEAS